MTSPVRWIPPRAPLVALCTIVLCLGACASPPRDDPTGLPRLDVARGRTLVVPLDGDWLRAESGSVGVLLSDGSRAKAFVRRIEVRVEPGATLRDDPGRWLPDPGIWIGVQNRGAPRDRERLRDSAPVLLLDLPVLSNARVVRAGGRDFAINWLPEPTDLLATPNGVPADVGDPWAPTFGSAGAVSAILLSLAWPESQSPIGRWRYRMMSGELRARFDPHVPDLADPRRVRPMPEDESGGLQPFDDPVIEALARQNEARWRVALARLWTIDADLAIRLKRRLAAVVDFGNGYIAPAWPTDHEAIDKLLSDLLDPALAPAQHASRVEGWLASLDTAVAWVVDDAGTRDATGTQAVPTVAVANLTELSTLCWVGERDARELKPLPAYGARRLTVEPREGAPPPAQPIPAIVHAGRWQASIQVFPALVGAAPPGLRLGPLIPDWNMESWLAMLPPAPSRSDRACVAMLHRSGPESWEVVVECGSSDARAPADDQVRLWFGPLAAPICVLRVDARGEVADEARRSDLVPTPADVRIVREGGLWSFRIGIPRGCIEDGGVLRLGLTRTDPSGAKSAWPRSLLPWQDEPGRLAIDTTRWGGW